MELVLCNRCRCIDYRGKDSLVSLDNACQNLLATHRIISIPFAVVFALGTRRPSLFLSYVLLRDIFIYVLSDYFKHFPQMNKKGAVDPNLSFLKLELLHILCTHEHFIILNLPFPSNDQSPNLSPSPSVNSMVSSLSSFSLALKDPSQSMGELSLEFREQHYLVGLLLCELKNSFDSK